MAHRVPDKFPDTRPLRPSDKIREHALRVGFDAVGIAPAELDPEAGTRLNTFIKAGYHGDMSWLADRVAQRSDPRSLWPQAQSVIVLGLSYAPADDPLALSKEAATGAISVYARHRDYHDIMKVKLKQLGQLLVTSFGCELKVFVDTAPVMEKPLAQRGGLGWQGKHTNLVSRTFGSWLLLGEIYTTLELAADEPTVDHCGSCSRCLDVCPTKAFLAPYQIDATLCISYLTIEHKGSIPHHLRKAIGNRIYGCDDCLAVCPWNKFAQPTSHHQLIARNDLSAPLLAHLVTLDDRQFRTMFSGSPVKRIGRNRFIRNVLIAIGNSGERVLLASARSLTNDPEPIVAEAAVWAVKELNQLPS